MKKSILSVLLCALLVTSCGTTSQPIVNEQPQQQEKAWEIAYKPYDQQEFYEKRGKEPVLLFFFREECATCALLSAALEKSGNLLSGKVTVYKVSYDKEQELRQEMHVATPGAVVGLDATGKIKVTQLQVVNFLQVQELIKEVLDEKKV